MFFHFSGPSVLYHVLPKKHLAIKNHSQNTKVRGESRQSPAEVGGGLEMNTTDCSFLCQPFVNPIT